MDKTLTYLLSSAAEFLSPAAQKQHIRDVFVRCWTKIRQAFMSSEVRCQAIEEIAIKEQLETMLECLRREEALERHHSEDDATMGPCLEFMLQTRLIETLVDFGETNLPEGLLNEVLGFLCQLLSTPFYATKLLPQESVRLPLQRIVLAAHNTPYCFEPANREPQVGVPAADKGHLPSLFPHSHTESRSSLATNTRQLPSDAGAPDTAQLGNPLPTSGQSPSPPASSDESESTITLMLMLIVLVLEHIQKVPIFMELFFGLLKICDEPQDQLEAERTIREHFLVGVPLGYISRSDDIGRLARDALKLLNSILIEAGATRISMAQYIHLPSLCKILMNDISEQYLQQIKSSSLPPADSAIAADSATSSPMFDMLHIPVWNIINEIMNENHSQFKEVIRENLVSFWDHKLGVGICSNDLTTAKIAMLFMRDMLKYTWSKDLQSLLVGCLTDANEAAGVSALSGHIGRGSSELMEAALSLLYYLLSTDHGAVTTMLATPERSLQWDLEASDSVSPSMTLESALYHLFQVAHIVNRKEHVEAMQAPDIIPLTRIFEQCFSRDTSSATIFAPVSRQCMLPKHLSGWQLRSVGNELLSNVLLTLHQFPTLSYNSQVLLTSSILVIARLRLGRERSRTSSQTSLCQKQSREAKTPLIDPYICNLICTLEMIHEKFTVYIIEDNILDVQAKMERIKSDIGSGPINSRQPTERQHSRKGDAPHLSALPTVRPSDLQSSETRQPPRPVVPTPSGRGRRSSFFVRRPPRTHENETKVLRSCLVLREFAVELSEVLFINQRASNFMPEDDSVDW